MKIKNQTKKTNKNPVQISEEDFIKALKKASKKSSKKPLHKKEKSD